jgi:DNA-binding IclR family transcriptional regulator
MMSTEKEPAANMRSLERALDVLDVLHFSTQPLRLSEVARRAGLHIATTQRILNVLEKRGRAERDANGYRSGMSSLFGAHSYLLSSPLVAAARPVLQDLADATGLTSSLFARSGSSRAVISRIDGTSPIRYVLPTGERLPLTQGAGKVLAAYLPKKDLDAILAEAGEIITADGTRVTKKAFAAEMAAIRAQGYAVSFQGRVVGVASLAAPILDRDMTCIAGVQVAGTVQDLTPERVPDLSAEVRRAAAAIADRVSR